MHVAWAEPFVRFRELFARAQEAQPKDPNQMWLGTVDEAGRPRVRVVLLKDFDERGFVFYTNLESDKARALLRHPFAALDFYWPALGEQVRVDGQASQVSPAEADAYFATRPRDAQLGAWASDQSRPLGSRLELDGRVAKAALRFPLGAVPRPPHWGGFRVAADRIEFWKAHPFRLHWRELYEKAGDGWEKGLRFP